MKGQLPTMQTLIALAVVGAAAAYLLYRALRKGKSGCDCGCCDSRPKKL
jgi:hypothetical protein